MPTPKRKAELRRAYDRGDCCTLEPMTEDEYRWLFEDTRPARDWEFAKFQKRRRGEYIPSRPLDWMAM